MLAQDWCVYLLRCGDGSLYCGITNDLPRRLAAHRSGAGARYTRGRGPLRVVYQEPCADRPAALRREHAVKQLSREEKQQLARQQRASRRRPAAAGEKKRARASSARAPRAP